MKALSVRQPWLWAILFARKAIENRRWKSVPRSMIGRTFLLQAAQEITRKEYFDACRFMLDRRLTSRDDLPDIPPIAGLARGAILGRARLAKIVQVAGTHRYEYGPGGLGDCVGCGARRFGATKLVCPAADPWAVPGGLGFTLTDVERLAEPLPCKGGQKFLDVPDELVEGARWEAVR